jgi:hypothetical protein
MDLMGTNYAVEIHRRKNSEIGNVSFDFISNVDDYNKRDQPFLGTNQKASSALLDFNDNEVNKNIDRIIFEEEHDQIEDEEFLYGRMFTN